MGAFRDSFWLPIGVVLTFTFLVGVVAGRYSHGPPEPTTDPRIHAMKASLDALEARVDEAEKRRCYMVEQMDLTIYPVPNLGTKKVEKP